MSRHIPRHKRIKTKDPEGTLQAEYSTSRSQGQKGWRNRRMASSQKAGTKIQVDHCGATLAQECDRWEA
ncbi:hypothetical protein RvY_11065 [Ramazzottius varieornatus]|uniref:Uncharacterized protein n=1 Tax=Ramazzottius varieornatus TaxID=947166 RepID=A0A1D1VKB2_RAMVA|nr:hypothetical protein RvY_11065 [Ramazzottius varieornatus]